jgi:GNAT superfamily N-acetyltransferase
LTAPASNQPLVIVRDADLSDIEVVVGFNAQLAIESEGIHLDRGILTRGVKLALADPERLRYWLAVSPAAGTIMGQAAVTREWSDWRNGWIWWLQSVYVAPEFRGRGVFRAIHAHIRERARASGDVVGFRLYVENHNEAAQKTYASVGLVPGGYRVLQEFWPETFAPKPDPVSS